MGILAPLFLAGLAALAVPVIWHLIRRTPRGRQEFSSLMFLVPSPPRLTRRSRLDQILLLLLRLGALALLVFAFARPFLRESAMLTLGDLPPRRVALLIDTSASMRRGDLWTQALAEAETKLSDLAPQDKVALLIFDDHLAEVVPFAEEQRTDAASAVETVRRQLRELRPTWRAGDLGLAVTTLAAALDDISDVEGEHEESQIVLISDLQHGERTDALRSFEWPSGVQIIARQVSPKQTTNAYAQLLESADGSEKEPRVRVTNASDSQADQFFVRWANHSGQPVGDETAVYVPPGQSRVVRLPKPESETAIDRIVLRGDDHEFDNICYAVSPPKQRVPLLFAGAGETNDPRSLVYYLRLAAESDSQRQIDLQKLAPDNPARLGESTHARLVVFDGKLDAGWHKALEAFGNSGGTLVLVPADRESAISMLSLVPGVELADTPAGRRADDFALLGQIDLTHALFSPFANPRYGDFSKIHFWKHRPVKLRSDSATRALASFDNGDPWLLEHLSGRGRVLLLTSGWQPDDSQLALSSKFVSLAGRLLDLAYGASQSLDAVAVGERARLGEPTSETTVVTRPDDTEVALESGTESFSQTDLPGVYTLGKGEKAVQFAVNLAAAESDTTPVDLEQLKQLGIPFGGELAKAERLDRLRQQRDTELESHQRIWQWLLFACLVLLIVETLMAGRASRAAENFAGNSAQLARRPA